MPPSEYRYQTWCERDGDSWSVDLPDLRIHTYGRTLVDAEDMARDAVAGVLEVPVEDVSVVLRSAEGEG
ncbi:type II toxin-antitoxin system HicB family antitoxin [Nocardiopsis sp. LOL_012]|uniref:type II toxin-antitoxin system HicB family antitoxin n=1 Tax=Nocardiopsis sp. LOL_012 TaxID=3345409 RepID=UPI003A862280